MTRIVVLFSCMALSWTCGGTSPSLGLIFLDGRAVEPVNDSLLAMTADGVDGILLYNHHTGAIDTVGMDVLHTPVHIEYASAHLYVSDTEGGSWRVSVFATDGTFDRHIDVSEFSSLAHQFAVLPDGKIVVETRDGQLLTIDGDHRGVFASVDVGMRPSLLIGAAGGVLHAVPDQHITLYNEFGNIRWRVEWPWAETAFVTDIAIDLNGRIHVIAGIPIDNTFVVYTIGYEDGDVVRWSQPGPYATFSIHRNGTFRPDSLEGVSSEQ